MHSPWKKEASERGQHTDSNVAGYALAKAGDFVYRIACGNTKPLRARRERPTCRRQTDIATCPLEESRTDGRLEAPNAAGQRWLCSEKSLGRATQMSRLGNDLEIAQVTEI